MDFGPVVKPLGITVKKEAGKVVGTSGDISHKGEFREPKKGGPRIFKILRLKILKKKSFLWHGASVDVGFIS